MVRRMIAVRTKSCLAVFALLLGSVASAQDYPRVETFFGYTYMRANSASNVPAFSANGGGGQFAVNFNKWIGFVADIGAVHNGNISDVHLDSTFTNFLFGPRISLRYSRIRPYFNVLFGGMHAGSSVAVSGIPVASNPIYLPGQPIPPNQPVTLRAVAAQTAFAMTAGGGLDIKINRHVSFRPIGLDYLLSRLQNLRSLQDNNQHSLRYTTGFNFTFGGEAPAPPPPPPPPMKACWNGNSIPASEACPPRTMDLRVSAGQSEVCQGASVTLTPSGVPENAAYQWTVGGEPISQASSLDFGTTGRDPGTYKVGLTVNAPEYAAATAESNITVRAYGPPTGTLQVSPGEIWFGQKATLAANFAPGQCGGSLRPPAYTASEGSVSGNEFDSSGLQFDPASTSEQRKTITLTARVADEKGAGTAEATLVVKKAPGAKRLPDIIFPAGSARVNNCGKRVLLEELKGLLETDTAGKVVLVGHVSGDESKPELDQQRALNAAAVISAGAGICYGFDASRVLVEAAGSTDNGVDYQSHFCGSTNERPGSVVKEADSNAKFRRVEVWFVPSGAALPASVKDTKDAASLSVSKLGCPR